MEQKPKRRLIRKNPPPTEPAPEVQTAPIEPVPEGYCYGPDSYDTYISDATNDSYEKYSPDYVMAQDKTQLYGNFCAPVIYDFINDLEVKKAPEPSIIVP